MHFNLDKVQTIKLFEELSPEELDEIFPLLHPMRVIEGEQLFRQGDKAHTFFVVMTGNYMLYFDDGRAFTFHHQGDIFGWSTVISPFQYTASVVALTEGEILRIPGEEFFQLLQGNVSLGDKLMKKIDAIVSQRLAFARGPGKTDSGASLHKQ